MYLPGMGPKRAEILKKELQIQSLEDLLYYFPYKYVDRSRYYYIHEIESSLSYIQLKGQIVSFQLLGEGRNQRLIAKFSDGKNFIDLIFTTQNYTYIITIILHKH